MWWNTTTLHDTFVLLKNHGLRLWVLTLRDEEVTQSHSNVKHVGIKTAFLSRSKPLSWTFNISNQQLEYSKCNVETHFQYNLKWSQSITTLSSFLACDQCAVPLTANSLQSSWLWSLFTACSLTPVPCIEHHSHNINMTSVCCPVFFETWQITLTVG